MQNPLAVRLRARSTAIAGVVAAVGVTAAICVTAATAGSRTQKWSNTASPFSSKHWNASRAGTHTFTRTRCRSNGAPRPVYTTTYTLFHHRGSIVPDENKGRLGTWLCKNDRRVGRAVSDDGENHYWKQSFNHGNASWVRLSGAGRVVHP